MQLAVLALILRLLAIVVIVPIHEAELVALSHWRACRVEWLCQSGSIAVVNWPVCAVARGLVALDKPELVGRIGPRAPVMRLFVVRF